MSDTAMIMPRSSRLLARSAASAGVLLLATLSLAAQQGTAARCERLKALANDQLVISTASWVASGPLATGRQAGPPSRGQLSLPAHCLVRGTLDPRTGVDGVHYGLGFELRMPAQWNGRFLFQGGGGLDGSVTPAIGSSVPSGGSVALAQGFAVISSDGGHEGLSAAFAADQQARLDYAYAGLGPVAELGQTILKRFYGASARDSYFAGCSNGGREAMMVAQRFPTLFNGIVAGDPGFNLSQAAIAEMWNVNHLEAAAPRTAQGAPILSEALTPADLDLVSNAVLKACDNLDGLQDGMINNISACQTAFNPKVLLCKADSTQNCLSAPKLEALTAIFDGPRDSAGHALYAGWPYDAGLGTRGWRGWKLGTSPTGVPNAADATLGLEAMRFYFMTPPDPTVTPATFDFDQALARTAQTAAINDATGTFFSSYLAHGGKLIIYQGMSDPVFSPDAIIDWYNKLIAQEKTPQDWARLFLIPGMNHCGGGPATDQFDALTAIVNWTENNQAPARLMAHGSSFPGLTRPLCPYPEYAQYQGGNPAHQQSFACVRR